MSNLESVAGQPKYRRIVLKLSGEALREPGSHEAITPRIVTDIAKQIQQVRDIGVEIAIVIGGGNIWRGLTASHRGMDRTTADYMGMLATVINCMALQNALEAIVSGLKLVRQGAAPPTTTEQGKYRSKQLQR